MLDCSVLCVLPLLACISNPVLLTELESLLLRYFLDQYLRSVHLATTLMSDGSTLLQRPLQDTMTHVQTSLMSGFSRISPFTTITNIDEERAHVERLFTDWHPTTLTQFRYPEYVQRCLCYLLWNGLSDCWNLMVDNATWSSRAFIDDRDLGPLQVLCAIVFRRSCANSHEGVGFDRHFRRGLSCVCSIPLAQRSVPISPSYCTDIIYVHWHHH